MWNIRICFLLRGEGGYFTKKFFFPLNLSLGTQNFVTAKSITCLCVYIYIYIQAFDIALRTL